MNVLLALVLLTVGAGRLAASGATVQGAARDAARAASQQRTPTGARTAAETTARTNLDGAGCTSAVVTVTLPAGRTPVVRVQVRCTVALTSLGLPGLGDRQVTRTVTAPVVAA